MPFRLPLIIVISWKSSRQFFLRFSVQFFWCASFTVISLILLCIFVLTLSIDLFMSPFHSHTSTQSREIKHTEHFIDIFNRNGSEGRKILPVQWRAFTQTARIHASQQDIGSMASHLLISFKNNLYTHTQTQTYSDNFKYNVATKTRKNAHRKLSEEE